MRRASLRRSGKLARTSATAATIYARTLRMLMGLAVALIVGASASMSAAAGALAAPTAHQRPLDGGSITITQPQASNGIIEGPVGLNMGISVSGAAPNDTYQLGYATQSDTCANGFTAFSSGQTATAQSDGTFTATFAWADATTVGTSYYVCAQDQTTSSNPTLQSTATFLVESDTAPSISVTAVGDFGGTALPNPPPANTLYKSGYAQITGSNFYPGGATLFAQLTSSPFSAPQYNPNTHLPVANDAQIISNVTGAFSVVVKLPDFTGSYYLNVVSQDGSTSVLPSLVASVQVNITDTPATPTPTVSPTPTITITPTPTTRSSRPTPQPSAKRIAAIIGLSSVSVLLFLIGVILLVSAAMTQRQRPLP